MIIDKEESACAFYSTHGCFNFTPDCRSVFGFETQLNGGYAGLCHAPNPGGVWQHGIQAQLVGASRKGIGPRPGTKVEILRVVRPGLRIKPTGAFGLSKPGSRHTVSIPFDKSQSTAGLQDRCMFSGERSVCSLLGR
jgi:hypothetical protein